MTFPEASEAWSEDRMAGLVGSEDRDEEVVDEVVDTDEDMVLLELLL